MSHIGICHCNLQSFQISLQSLQKIELSTKAGLTMLLNAIFLVLLEKEVHYNFQKTCHKLQSPTATCNVSKISLQSLQKLGLSSTAGLAVLTNAIFLMMLEKEIYYSFQKIRHTLEFPNATCNHFKISMRILAKIRTELYSWSYHVTQCNFSYNVTKINPLQLPE